MNWLRIMKLALRRQLLKTHSAAELPRRHLPIRPRTEQRPNQRKLPTARRFRPSRQSNPLRLSRGLMQKNRPWLRQPQFHPRSRRGKPSNFTLDCWPTKRPILILTKLSRSILLTRSPLLTKPNRQESDAPNSRRVEPRAFPISGKWAMRRRPPRNYLQPNLSSRERNGYWRTLAARRP